MVSRKEIKAQAKAQLKGNLGMIILCWFIYLAIAVVLGMIPIAGLIGSLVVMPPIMIGIMMVMLNVTYGEKAEVSTMFAPFRNLFGQSIVLNLLIGIFTFLWSLLFVIPGIIKSFSYSMSYYILAENPNMSANEAITESRRIMDGHKFEYFVLILSFIPWFLLACVTFGIAYIYVIPYMQLTIVNFYHNIKRQPENVACETVEAEVIE